MIRPCTDADFALIETIINETARAYRGAIPADCWHEPYMTGSDLKAEIAAGVNFGGWDELSFHTTLASFLALPAGDSLDPRYSPSSVACSPARSTHSIPIGPRSGLLEDALSAMLRPNSSAHPQLSLAGALPIRP